MQARAPAAAPGRRAGLAAKARATPSAPSSSSLPLHASSSSRLRGAAAAASATAQLPPTAASRPSRRRARLAPALTVVASAAAAAGKGGNSSGSGNGDDATTAAAAAPRPQSPSSSSSSSLLKASASKDFSLPLDSSGGGDGGLRNRGGSGGGGGGGGGDGGGDSGANSNNNDDAASAPAAAIAALLAAAGRPASALPADLAAALAAGRLTPELLRRYLALEASAVQAWLMRFPGFRERLLADPGFLVKVAIECGIGVCTKMSAEYAKRGGEQFPKELDFVAANVLMAIIADFMLVWLPAPTLSLAPRAAAAAAGSGGIASRLGRVFAGCPENAFQCVQPGSPPFTLAQRLGSPIRNGLKLFGVGLTASFVGVAATNALTAARAALDPSFAPLNPPQDVLAMSSAYGLYMATSSNLRYQFLAGVVEERGIERLFRGNAAACGALSFVVRTGNTFLGSLLWVDFIRLLGMQKAGGAGH